ncbi:MAG: cyclase family protein [Parvularculaceae bacterium]|nr:cyclase family protein [Parvularculaceae bacterium]
MSSVNDFGAALMGGKVRTVDLTHPLDPDFPVIILPEQFGQCAPFKIEEVSRYDERGPAWYWRNFSCNEHTGTHFDAPVHWITGKDIPNSSVDTLAVDGFVRPACVLDFTREVAADPDFVLTADHIRDWEKKNGEIPHGWWVLLRTDWSKREWNDYLNLREDGAHSPGPDASAVRLMIERDAVGFGVETVGTDAGQAHGFEPQYPAHTLLHGAGKFGLQCLANLDQLPARGALIIAPPLKIKNGSGSPLRVLAMIDA